jgi:hypothetical protein
MLAPSRVQCSGESRVPTVRRRHLRSARQLNVRHDDLQLDRVDNFSATGSSAASTGELPIRRSTTKRTVGRAHARRLPFRASLIRRLRVEQKFAHTHTASSHLGEHWLLSIADGSSLTCWPNKNESSATRSSSDVTRFRAFSCVVSKAKFATH